MIASHYAEPLGKAVRSATELLRAPSEDSEVVARLEPGDPFAMLENSVGWAWGYGGPDRLVGYVRSGSLG